MSTEQTETPQLDRSRVTVAESGTWLLAEDLQQALSARVMDGGNTLLDCGEIDYLDACSLQILLAFVVQKQGAGGTVGLSHVSAGLAHWFGQVGATSLVDLARLAHAA